MSFTLPKGRLADSIPNWTYVLVVVVWVGIQALLHWLLLGEPNPPPLVFRILWPLWMATVFAPMLFFTGWISTDSRQRGMWWPLWTALAFLPPGIALYFVFRLPKLVTCGRCGARQRSDVAFCASCGQALGTLCPGCRREVAPSDSFCPHCGQALPAVSKAQAPPQKNA